MKAHERIKNYIDTNGVSLELLFRKCGISRNTLGTMLTGKRKNCVDEYEAIRVALNVETNRFLTPHSELLNFNVKNKRNLIIVSKTYNNL